MAFTLAPPTPTDFPRLAEIAHAAFADDEFTRVAFRNVSRADNYAASLAGFANPAPGSEIVCAREAASGAVVGYAQWSTPVQHDPHAPPHVHAPFPNGIDAVVFGEMIAEVGAAEARLTGGKPHWSLSILVVDPAFQGRGAGAQLVADGVARAHAQGLPLFVAGSKKGTRLYERLGFVVKETPDITSAKVPASMLVKEMLPATGGA